MSTTPPADDTDPRAPPSDTVDLRPPRPAVAATARTGGPWLTVGGAALAGLAVFAWLAGHRPRPASETSATPSGAAATSELGPASAPVPPDLAAAEAAARQPPALPAPTVAYATPTPPPPSPVVPGRPTTASEAVEPNARRKAPALVVDLGEPEAAGATNTTGAAAAGKGGTLNSDEQFAQRVEGADAPERARATQLHDLSSTIPQGVMIPGVLETALDSDLPGFTRAVVSRDVRGFDGSAVLVPRGSRVIGQYRSAAALGASRAFVIWTRIIRPDGVSIEIGSSGTDPLGRAGLAGSVDRHFFQRFGGAILLSVVNAGVSSAFTRNNNTQVYVGSSQEATGLGNVADLTNIPPTLKVPQGTPIRIFVARDLDFSPVQPVSPAP